MPPADEMLRYPEDHRPRRLEFFWRAPTSGPTIDPGPSGEDPDIGSGNLAMSDHRVGRRCAFGPVDVAGPCDPIDLPHHRPAPSTQHGANKRSDLCERQNYPAEVVVKQATEIADGAASPSKTASQHHEQRIERLIGRLPERLQTTIRWLRQPGLRWVRLLAGLLFIAGAFLSILPVFGIWMLPLGLMLLAEDISLVRRVRNRFLDWIEGHRPHWFACTNNGSRTQASTPRSSSVAGADSCAGTHQ
jgi:hypothetical protein